MALEEADYRFVYVDVGCNGKVSNRGVFNGCSLDVAMKQRNIG